MFFAGFVRLVVILRANDLHSIILYYILLLDTIFYDILLGCIVGNSVQYYTVVTVVNIHVCLGVVPQPC